MKSKNKAFVLVSLMVLVGFIGIVSTGYSAGTDIAYSFESDNFFNSTTPISEDYNVKNKTEYTGHYNATYSFENEIDGTSGTDIDYIDIDDSGALASVIINNNLGYHDKILNLTADDGGDGAIITHNLDNINDGIFEFWIRTTVNNYRIRIFCYSAGSPTLDFGFGNDGKLYYHDGVVWNQALSPTQSYQIDTWYHWKIDFDCGTDTMDWYVNGILVGDDLDFRNDAIFLDNIKFSAADDYDYSGYFDAVGFSWDKTSYTNEWFDLSGEGSEPLGITWDGDNYWVCFTDLGNNGEIYKYTDAGVYAGVHFDTSSEDKYPMGLTWDDNHIWMVGSFTDEVYQYTNAGVYTGIHFDVGTEDSMPVGITWDGEFFWIIGSDTEEVYKYTDVGIYTGIHFDTNTEDNNPADIVWVDDSLWVLGYNNQEVYQYTNAGVYTGIHFDVGTEDNAQEGMLFIDGYFWLTGLGNVKAYEYEYIEFPYNVGDNLIPYQMVYDSYEVDKWDFLYEGIGDAFEIGDDNPNGWTDIEDGGGDEVNMVAGIYYEIQSSGDESGTMKDDFDIDELHILNFSITFNVAEISQVLNNYVYFRIYSNDSTEIARIFFDEDYNFGYYDGVDRINLATGLSEDVWYDFNLYIDYEIDLCVLRLNSSSSFIGEYHFPLFVLDKIGLNKIAITCPTDTGTTELLIDDIGVYIEGESITEEFGFLGAGIGNYEGGEDYYESWDFNEFNLLALDLIGNDVSVYMYLMEQTLIAPIWNPEVIVSTQDWTGLETFNMYDFTYDVHRSRDYVYGGLLQFYIYSGTNLTINSLSIDGVKMIEGSNEYPLEFNYGNVDIDESYFYVLGDKLYYTITYDDSNLEFIEASFDIIDRLGENRSARYYSDTNGNYAEFRLKYTDATVSGQKLQHSYYISNLILAQEKELDYFQLLITDDDKMSAGITTGRMSGIVLEWIPNISITITTLNLLGMITVLIIIVIPTLIFARRLGSKVIIPIIFLMSLLCVATELIPIWLFVVITISLGSFYIVGSKIKAGGI